MNTNYPSIEVLGDDLVADEGHYAVRLFGLSQGGLQLLLASLFYQLKRRRLILLLPHQRDFAEWTDYLHTLESEAGRSDTAILPATVAWGNDAFVNHDLSKQQRLYGLSLMAEQRSGIILTTPKGLAQLTFPKSIFKTSAKTWRVGDEIDIESITMALGELGYTASSSVEEPGRYAMRGGILDLFPPGRDRPVRIEFFGDDIASMREFSPDTQRSISELGSIWVGPAAEAIIAAGQRDRLAQRLYDRWIEQDIDQHDRDGMLRAFREGIHFPAHDMYEPLMRDNSAAGVSYLDEGDIIVCPKSLPACVEAYREIWEDSCRAFEEDKEHRRPVIEPSEHLMPPQALEDALNAYARIELSNPFEDTQAQRVDVNVPPLPLLPQGSPTQTFDQWLDLFKRQKTLIMCQSEEQIARISHLLSHRDLKVERIDQPIKAALTSVDAHGGLIAGVGDIAGSCWSADGKTLVVPEEQIFGRKQIRRKSPSQKLKNYLSSFKELKMGGLVVHVDHGIGRYCGLANLDVAGQRGDFLILEYAGGDKVYLPVDKLNLLQRYNPGTEGKSTAPLDKLKGLGWERRKSRVKKAVRDMADQLLKVQAQRALSQGIPYGPINDDYYRFEADFPYTETEDQLRAVADVNADMTAGRPMDRLVCGDVGFGKTEIALRAAFRAVLDGYQVLVLVPTTVLCYQHFRTFNARMDKYGIKVAQANRFVRGLDMKLAIEGLANRSVDILIGTHRLLSKDIKANRLGLLIIDEEQRFGVGHKEKLKEIRASCDVLTLTATPIPRTLHMAMLGLRDISIIATPPMDRLAVKTYVTQFDEALIKEAIDNEVNRGGQVFFLHNRVEDIVEMQSLLKKLCPLADVRHAHGQMGEHKLEEVIVDFIEQKFSVLLCTTIIESGIDMPNVNTLIVNRADRFGLAQLYQIRGRVGRSTRQAYAYFLTPPRAMVTEDAVKRLDVLSTYQDLGSGFQIASHDLEIRGAGNLLGAEQSGKVGEVGLELYTDMLEEAIREVRGEVVEQSVDTEIKVPFSAIIPSDYIQQESLRLELYKRIFSSDSREHLGNLAQETHDRFGELPIETRLLFKVAELKQILKVCRVVLLGSNKFSAAELRFAPLKSMHIDAILEVVRKKPQIYSLAPDYRLQIYLNHRQEAPIEKQIDWIAELIGLLEPLVHAFETPN